MLCSQKDYIILQKTRSSCREQSNGVYDVTPIAKWDDARLLIEMLFLYLPEFVQKLGSLNCKLQLKILECLILQ